jgi:GT2 family glycosyltransferase
MYNNLDYNKMCIESIRQYTEVPYEIVVVDNGSTDGTRQWLSEQKDIKAIYNSENLGFPKGCNQGIEAAGRDNDILLLNNDVIVTPSWLKNMQIALYSNESIGAVGAITNYASNGQGIPIVYKDIEGMIKFSTYNNISNAQSWEEKVKVIGFCMLIKRHVINKVGYLDERFTPGNFEDDDYSLRIILQGYKILLCRDVFIHHFGSKSFKENKKAFEDLLIKNREKFKNKWNFDPMYYSDIRNDSQLKNLLNMTYEQESVKVNQNNVNEVIGTLIIKIENQIQEDRYINNIVMYLKRGNLSQQKIIESIEQYSLYPTEILEKLVETCEENKMFYEATRFNNKIVEYRQ